VDKKSGNPFGKNGTGLNVTFHLVEIQQLKGKRLFEDTRIYVHVTW